MNMVSQLHQFCCFLNNYINNYVYSSTITLLTHIHFPYIYTFNITFDDYIYATCEVISLTNLRMRQPTIQMLICTLDPGRTRWIYFSLHATAYPDIITSISSFIQPTV